MKPRTNFLVDSKIFSSHFALLLALFLEVTLVWAGDKPWKAKPYQAWDAKDVQTIMTESPWVQVTTIRRTWLPISEKDVPPPPQISGGGRQMPQASPNVSGGSPAAKTRESEASEQELNVYVYWDSSRVMRAAQARQRVLHGEMKDSEVESYARAPQEEYEIVLSMQDMTPFLRNDEKFFQGQAFLEMRRAKLRLPPSHVVYQRDANGILKQVVFFFPKKTSGGLATIGSDQTDVEFICKVADSKIHVDFKTQKMTDQSGPDL